MLHRVEKCKYEGEMDYQNLPRGYGIATNREGKEFRGTWKDGKLHGICKCFKNLQAVETTFILGIGSYPAEVDGETAVAVFELKNGRLYGHQTNHSFQNG